MLKSLSLLLVLLVIIPSQADEWVPDMKFSLDFTQIDVFKNTTLRPIIKNLVSNLTIKGPIDLNLSLILATAEVQLSNITVQDFSLNWDKTVLTPVDETHIALTVFDATIKIENDYDIKVLELDLGGRANITITNITTTIILQFSNVTTGSGFSAAITNFTLNYDSLQMDVDSPIISGLVNKIFKTFKCLVLQKLTEFIMSDLNPQISALTSQPIQIPVNPSILESLAMQYISKNLDMKRSNGDTYIVNISMSRAPYVRYVVNNTDQFTYLTLAIDVSVFNNRTKSTPVVKEKDLLPNRIFFDYDVQVFLCNSLLTQLQWVIIDSGILHLTLNDAMVPETSPVRLNTSSIMLLVPGMTTKYGQKKGIYLAVSAGSAYSQIVFRSGRLVGEVSLILDFYVDKDSSNYKNQTLENCTQCEKALSLNATMLLALHADNQNMSVIYVNIINVDFYYMTVLSTQIDFDVNSFQTLMKDVGRSFVPILNANLSGIANPFIGNYSIKDLQFRFSIDYLFLRLGLDDGRNGHLLHKEME